MTSSSTPAAISALMLSRLLEMKSVPHSDVYLQGWSFNSTWIACFQYEHEGTKLKLEAHAETPDLAVEDLHLKWTGIYRNGISEIRPSLLTASAAAPDMPF